MERYASEEIKIKSHLFDEIFNNGLWSRNNCLNIPHLQELSLRNSLFCQKATAISLIIEQSVRITKPAVYNLGTSNQ